MFSKLIVTVKKSEYTPLVLLLLFVAITRFALLYESIIPFTFDHAKDSLAIMDMAKTLSPSLIGPWTSIPGLYFGPGWYYLLLPAYVIGNFHPIAAVLLMVALLLVQIYLAYRYLSPWVAVILGLTPFSFIITTSAWNPFPMTFVSLLLIILLIRIAKQKTASVATLFFLGLIASFGFHFSSAYAVFYPFIIAACLLIWKIPITVKHVLMAALGLALPFFPQFIFELRHDFVQTQAIVQYFSADSIGNTATRSSFEVIQVIFGELKNALLPEIRGVPSWVTLVLRTTLIGLTAFYAIRSKIWKRKEVVTAGVLLLTFIGIPLLGYQFLHFNLWYIIGMVPAAVYGLAVVLTRNPRWLQVFWLTSFIIGAVSFVWFFHAQDKYHLASYRTFLPIKLEALEQVRHIANGRPFASYHYVPDLYDFSYQYLYLRDGFLGKALPTEFAYEPNVTPYVTQKESLLAAIARRVPEATQFQDAQPEVIFYIVEEPEKPHLLEEWWGRQRYSAIIEEIPLSDTVTLYVAEP